MSERGGVAAPAERARRANGAGAEKRGRFSVRRKTEAVLRLVRGEGLEVLSRELGVTAATLSGWRDAFLAGGQASLLSRPSDEGDERLARLRSKVGELTMANALLEEKIDHLEAGRPLAGRRPRR